MNDDVRDYIEEFRLFDDAKNKVTLRALGSHLSGLGRDSTPDNRCII
jgi:CubicO group peptidase (beta-lactamase class C family)